MTRVLQTPTFKRSAKRLPKRQKKDLDDAVRAIVADPTLGDGKRGDLAGVRVYKFRLNRQTALLAYEVREADGILKLLALGSHDNFYRDIKR